jgi:hypothetical protein
MGVQFLDCRKMQLQNWRVICRCIYTSRSLEDGYDLELERDTVVA